MQIIYKNHLEDRKFLYLADGFFMISKPYSGQGRYDADKRPAIGFVSSKWERCETFEGNLYSPQGGALEATGGAAAGADGVYLWGNGLWENRTGEEVSGKPQIPSFLLRGRNGRAGKCAGEGMEGIGGGSRGKRA